MMPLFIRRASSYHLVPYSVVCVNHLHILLASWSSIKKVVVHLAANRPTPNRVRDIPAFVPNSPGDKGLISAAQRVPRSTSAGTFGPASYRNLQETMARRRIVEDPQYRMTCFVPNSRNCPAMTNIHWIALAAPTIQVHKSKRGNCFRMFSIFATTKPFEE